MRERLQIVATACAVVLIAYWGWYRAPRAALAETEIDFGEVLSGSQAFRELHIRNLGNEDLVLIGVTGTCGCIASVASRSVLKPNETGLIRVIFDAADKLGTVNEGVRIVTNDPKRRALSVKVRGFVRFARGDTGASGGN
jgi:Protein of unknown function (DUF1573)